MTEDENLLEEQEKEQKVEHADELYDKCESIARDWEKGVLNKWNEMAIAARRFI